MRDRTFLARIGRGESVDHFETIRVRKDGTYIDVSTTISPIRDSSGVIVGASKIARDITERKRAEQRLADKAEELARSNRDLEQFAYAASHVRPMRKWSDVSFSIVQQDSPMPFGLGDIDTRRVIMTTSLVALWEMPCEITRLSSEGLR